MRVVSEQSPYNLLDRRVENELLPMCRRHGVGVLCWSPLAMGMLAGRYATTTGREADSRAALRGGIYAERVTTGGHRDRQPRSPRWRASAATSRRCSPRLDEGPAGRDRADHRPEVGRAARRACCRPVTWTLPDDLRAACDELVTPGSFVASFFNSAPWMAWKH